MRYAQSVTHCCGAICLILVAFAAHSFGQANGKIAFASIRDGNSEIYVMNPDGTDQRRLTFDLLPDESPAWSPDGRRIAFISERSQISYKIKLMDPDGTDAVVLHSVSLITRLPSSCGRVSLTWSPDGARIAFAENGDIYAIETSGSKPPVRLTNHPDCEYDPSWSPDGLTLAFVRRYGAALNSFHSDIHVMPISGAMRARPLFRVGYISVAFAPHWSPDGKFIVYGFSDGDDVLRKGRSNGQGVQWWFLPGIRFARWSPDGRKLVFSRFNGTTSTSEIWTVDADGIGERVPISWQGDFHPSWGKVLPQD